MHVSIVGGHGQIARLLTRRLVGEGHEVRGIIRDASQRDDLRDDGAAPSVVDIEEAGAEALAAAIRGSDAVVFAAGAGPGSGAGRKETVDYGGAVLLMRAAEAAGVSRYVMVSSMGTDDPPQGDSVFEVYLRAKARADADLMDSDLDWTVVRPGRLTNDPGRGTVTLARHVERGEIARADVADVLRHVLANDGTIGHVFEVVSGDTPIPDALAGLSR